MIFGYSGGLEIAFDKQKSLELELKPEKDKFTLNDLIIYLRDEQVKGKPEFFVSGDSL